MWEASPAAGGPHALHCLTCPPALVGLPALAAWSLRHARHLPARASASLPRAVLGKPQARRPGRSLVCRDRVAEAVEATDLRLPGPPACVSVVWGLKEDLLSAVLCSAFSGSPFPPCPAPWPSLLPLDPLSAAEPGPCSLGPHYFHPLAGPPPAHRPGFYDCTWQQGMECDQRTQHACTQ